MATAQPSDIHDKVARWIGGSGKTQHLQETLELLTLLKDELYVHYQPFPERAHFFERLVAWMEGASTELEQQLLFQFVPWLLFVGPREMDALFRGAFMGPTMKWLIEQSATPLDDPNFAEKITHEVGRTWFGSLAGMDIGSFCRVNAIQGQSYRCDFRSLSRLGNASAVRRHMADDGFSRIIAVEDFVGSGQQMIEACDFLRRLRPIRILVCPIIVAPDGNTQGLRIEHDYAHITYRPLFVIPPTALLPATAPLTTEPVILRRMRRLLVKLWSQVEGAQPTQQLYGPFGLGEFGSLVLTYLNCPDNVPPLVHHQSDTWRPLFPRSSREG
jgi:hypothetical protein